MNNILAGVIGSIATAALIGIATAIARWVKSRVKVSGPNTEAIEVMARDLAVHRALLFMLTEGYRPQLLALKGILEALREKMNGSFERPYTAICGALDAYDNTLRKIAQGECEEKNAV